MRSPFVPRERTKYKRPRRLNAVSVVLLLITACLVYFAIFTWPVYILHLRAKGELQYALPAVYRLNLLGEDVLARDLPTVEEDLVTRLRRVGVTDENLQVFVETGGKNVAIEARFSTRVYYPWLDHTRRFRLSPRAWTDAARVEW